MLRFSLESAPYTELDFPKFNPDGFRRVQQAVGLAQQAKTIARDPEEMRRAVESLRGAAERKTLEQQVALSNFETQRRKSFGDLRELVDRFRSTRLAGSARLEMETRIDHLITLFNLKDFDALSGRLHEVRSLLERRVGSVHRPAATAQRVSAVKPPAESATALFQKAFALENAGRRAQAIAAYREVLERNPRHFQAIHRLQRLDAAAGFLRR